MPVLEAMGPAPISRALNAVALCNRMLDNQQGHEAQRVGRLAFAPSIRIFVQRERTFGGVAGRLLEDEDQPEQADQQSATAAPRRSMQLHLRLVARASRVPRQDEDVIRVSSRTDIARLSGLISTRWAGVEAGLESDILVQAMGSASINTMVRAFAMSWEKAARSYEGGFREAAFSCLPSHMALAGEESGKAPRYSGLQCMVIPPEFE